jgi:hypothetical protein
MYKRLHHVFKPSHSGAISHLELPGTDDWQWPYDPKIVTEWRRECDTKKVEGHLFDRNTTCIAAGTHLTYMLYVGESDGRGKFDGSPVLECEDKQFHPTVPYTRST